MTSIFKKGVLRRVLNNAHDKHILVGTHDGVWHADELIAIALLQEYLRCFYDDMYSVDIVRTRDEEILNKCSFVFDVGGKDSIGEKQICLDHHGEVEMKSYDNGILYATCGKVAELLLQDWAVPKINNLGLYAVQSRDNGQKTAGEINCRELPNPFTFVTKTNVLWNDEETNRDSRFKKTLKMVRTILRYVLDEIKAMKAGDSLVKEEIEKLNIREKILVLPTFVKGWQKMVCKANERKNNIKLVIYPAITEGYSIESPPSKKGDKEMRMPENWWGKEKAELAKITGLKSARFCHRNGFMSGFNDLEEAKKAARLALIS